MGEKLLWFSQGGTDETCIEWKGLRLASFALGGAVPHGQRAPDARVSRRQKIVRYPGPWPWLWGITKAQCICHFKPVFSNCLTEPPWGPPRARGKAASRATPIYLFTRLG